MYCVPNVLCLQGPCSIVAFILVLLYWVPLSIIPFILLLFHSFFYTVFHSFFYTVFHSFFYTVFHNLLKSYLKVSLSNFYFFFYSYLFYIVFCFLLVLLWRLRPRWRKLRFSNLSPALLNCCSSVVGLFFWFIPVQYSSTVGILVSFFQFTGSNSFTLQFYSWNRNTFWFIPVH